MQLLPLAGGQGESCRFIRLFQIFQRSNPFSGYDRFPAALWGCIPHSASHGRPAGRSGSGNPQYRTHFRSQAPSPKITAYGFIFVSVHGRSSLFVLGFPDGWGQYSIFCFSLQQVGNTKLQQKTECQSTPFQGIFHYLAYSTALVSRMTLTLI